MKPCSIAYVFIIATLAGNYAAFAQTTNSQGTQAKDVLPRIPVPPGSFGIGRVGCDWTDPSRPDHYSSVPNAHRELMVYMWYPTSAKSADTKGPYLPGARGMDALPEVRGVMRQEFGNLWSAMVSGAIFSHAREGAPVANGSRLFPLIVFSHGLGSAGFNYTCLIEDLVSRGYVVASIEHTYTALAVWFPDGRVVLSHKEQPPSGLTKLWEQRTGLPGTTLLFSVGPKRQGQRSSALCASITATDSIASGFALPALPNCFSVGPKRQSSSSRSRWNAIPAMASRNSFTWPRCPWSDATPKPAKPQSRSASNIRTIGRLRLSSFGCRGPALLLIARKFIRSSKKFARSA
jgi:hypothetical protein